MAFMPYGYNAFVLHYSVGVNSETTFPAQLIQASKAMKYIKDHAEEYNIDPEKVFVVGFSAGGHLAACLGTMWHKQEIYNEIDMQLGYNKPEGVMLIYAVVTGVESYSSNGTFYNLLGTKNPSDLMLFECSIERNIDDRACPAYIVNTANDELVDVRNALLLAGAYASKGIPFELHIYPDGPHGMALGNRITKCGNIRWENQRWEKWIENAVLWADALRDS